MKNILIGDSDTHLTEILTQYLQSEEFTVTCTYDGDLTIKKALNQPFSALIIDLMLPRKNGFEVIRAIREHSEIPILILTAKDDDLDRVISLELGADDYILKPCNPRELTARLKAILRRTEGKPATRPIIEYHNVLVDGTKRVASIEGVLLDLTNTEFNILEMLIKSPGQAFSKEELTEYALGRKFTAYDRSIDVHISNLRNKLGENPSGENWLKTVRGFGYMFNA